MATTSPVGAFGGRLLSAAVLDLMAHGALAHASAEAGRDPRVLAVDLGFRLLPVSSRHACPCELTTADRLVYCLDSLPQARDWGVRHALAHGLLLRDGREHSEADVTALARRLQIVVRNSYTG